MVHQLVKKALKSGRTFASEAAFVTYVNRVVGYITGRGKAQRTTKAHAARVISLYKKGQLKAS